MRLYCRKAFAIAALIPSLALAHPVEVEIVRVVDGDTLDVRLPYDTPGWNVHRVRLVDVNTPEPRSRCEADTEAEQERLRAEERELAARAENYVMDRLAEAERVTVDRVGEDSLNRALVYVYLDGESLNQALLDAGHALPYVEGTGGKQWCGR